MASSAFLSMRTGSQLIQTLSNSLYSNVYYVFDELISNAYDADATEVKINLYDNEIRVEDNGEGMGRKDIENFFDLGYSPKSSNRSTQKFKRVTIGKFGIGKLTMAVICDTCIIETTKNDVTTTAKLSFPKILNHRYLHESQIPIEIQKNGWENGTRIILKDLKKPIDFTFLKRRIIRTMPLNPNFKIILNGIELKPEDVITGDTYPIEFDGDKIGKINGYLKLSDKAITDFAGVYIRVNGRIVNADDPNWLNIATTVGGGLSFANRIYCVADADKLDECILANRNAFKKDHPIFEEFKQLLLREIRRLAKQIQEGHTPTNLRYESEIAKKVIEHQINKMIEHADPPIDWMTQYERRPDAQKIKGVIEKIKRKQSSPTANKSSKQSENKTNPQNPNIIKFNSDDRIIKIGRKKFKFKIVTDMGKDDPECVFDTLEGVIYINANHPQYLVSRDENSLYCHFRKAIAFELSKTLANNLYNELVQRYDTMMHTEIEVIE